MEAESNGNGTKRDGLDETPEPQAVVVAQIVMNPQTGLGVMLSDSITDRVAFLLSCVGFLAQVAMQFRSTEQPAKTPKILRPSLVVPPLRGGRR